MMKKTIIRANSLEGLVGQLGVQTLGSVPAFPKEDLISLAFYETTLLEPMSTEEAALLLSLDSEHNPLLAELWRDDVNDDLVANP